MACMVSILLDFEITCLYIHCSCVQCACTCPDLYAGQSMYVSLQSPSLYGVIRTFVARPAVLVRSAPPVTVLFDTLCVACSGTVMVVSKIILFVSIPELLCRPRSS